MELEAKDEDARLPVHPTSARRPEVFVSAVANANVGASDFRMQKMLVWNLKNAPTGSDYGISMMMMTDLVCRYQRLAGYRAAEVTSNHSV